jgi:hypothetical protein
MRLRTTSAIFGAITALGLAGSAQALPATKTAVDTNATSSNVEQVNYRCWWRYGYRHCRYYRPYAYYGSPYYGYGYRPYYSYGYSPGLSFYVGPRYRYGGYYGYRRSWW